MDINQLQYIKMIGETKHMSKAAEKLYISQPALHKALRKVEEELNSTLFYRNGHELLPTDTGQLVLEYANNIINSMDEMKDKITKLQNLEKGNVVIGFPSIVGTLYLPEMLIQFKKKYPGISLRTVESGGNQLCSLVESGDLDVAIVVRPIYLQTLNEIPIFRDQVVVSVNKDHPWAKRNFVTVKDFENVPFNTFDSTFNVHTQLMNMFKNSNVSPNFQFIGASTQFLYELSTLSNGILVLPKPAIEFYSQGNTALIPFNPTFPWELCLIFKKNTFLPIATKTLIGHIQEHFLHISD